ncbi:hypothetical protein Tco_1019338 [Tanacetum coccineum]|uniref:Uncharacterized protein n=1 Tax=Tanacetum coccineum TaxID=301880 RepID=A0ABQ5FWV7_9ASTR
MGILVVPLLEGSLIVFLKVAPDSRITGRKGCSSSSLLYPLFTSSVTASPLEEGGDRTDFVTGPSLRTIGPSARLLLGYDLGYPLLYWLRTTGRSGSGFDAGSIRAEEAIGAGSEEIYVPEWTERSLGVQALSALLLDICLVVPATNVLSTVVIVPHTDPSVSVEDYDNPDSADVVPENATLGSESEGNIDASARGGFTFSQLGDEVRDAVL